MNSKGDIAEYGGFDLLVAFAGVESQDTPDANVWPDCFTEATNTSIPGLEALGCAVEPPNDVLSNYLGLVGTMDFVCLDSGSVELLHGFPNTSLVDGDIIAHYEAEAGGEALQINCVNPPVAGIAHDVLTTDAIRSQSSTGDRAWYGNGSTIGILAVALSAVFLLVGMAYCVDSIGRETD